MRSPVRGSPVSKGPNINAGSGAPFLPAAHMAARQNREAVLRGWCRDCSVTSGLSLTLWTPKNVHGGFAGTTRGGQQARMIPSTRKRRPILVSSLLSLVRSLWKAVRPRPEGGKGAALAKGLESGGF